MGMTAKTFGVRPSDYLPELGTWERYCFDELVAFQMAIEEKRQFDEAKGGKGDEKPASDAESTRPNPKDNALSVLNHEAFRKK
jgi:hypothetical protein